ncbi:unnamed protein product [Linum trigynum]|uniref:Uncharacterized protein n=1 Tax=Linum trigynum TaxID=586398 RepID=A0AAV2CXK9_9ROSI
MASKQPQPTKSRVTINSWVTMWNQSVEKYCTIRIDSMRLPTAELETVAPPMSVVATEQTVASASSYIKSPPIEKPPTSTTDSIIIAADPSKEELTSEVITPSIIPASSSTPRIESSSSWLAYRAYEETLPGHVNGYPSYWGPSHPPLRATEVARGNLAIEEGGERGDQLGFDVGDKSTANRGGHVPNHFIKKIIGLVETNED